MNGSVRLERNDANGTTVTFTLVAEKIHEKTEPPPPPSPDILLTNPNRSLSTLVVEDEPINQQILQAILNKLGHRTSLAENGQVALELLLSNHFDIVLMDVQMPEMDGFEATRKIRTSKKFEHIRNIPIIALTAYAMANDKERCLASGMSGYLAKPVDMQQLGTLLQQLTSNPSLLCSSNLYLFPAN